MHTKKIAGIFAGSAPVKALGVFLIYSAGIFGLHLAKKGFFGVDPYYHAKHAWLMARTGDLTLVEPWIDFHFLTFAPCDPWWLHHVISSFLMKFMDPVLALKLFSSLLVGLAFAFFYLILNSFKVKNTFLWTFLYFSSSLLFLGRLVLERPHLFAIAFVPLLYFLAVKKRYFFLFLTSLVYALFYNLVIYPIAIISLAAAIDFFTEKKLELKSVIAVTAGMAGGIILHPDSLNYLYVIFIHSFGVIYYKFTGVYLAIGGEVQPLLFKDFLRQNLVVLSFYLVSAAGYICNRSYFSAEEKKILRHTFFISAFWFFLTLFVPRAAEYWMPFAWIFIAVFLTGFARSRDCRLIFVNLSSIFNLKTLSCLSVSAVAVLIAYNYYGIIKYLRESNAANPDSEFEEVNRWLVENTEKGEIVYYTNWSFWPRMFFYNDHNRYVAGMDPTFLYEYDPEMALLYLGISYQGKACQYPCMGDEKENGLLNEGDVIKNKFRSRFVVTRNQSKEKVNNMLKNEEFFLPRLQNRYLTVYEVK